MYSCGVFTCCSYFFYTYTHTHMLVVACCRARLACLCACVFSTCFCPVCVSSKRWFLSTVLIVYRNFRYSVYTLPLNASIYYTICETRHAHERLRLRRQSLHNVSIPISSTTQPSGSPYHTILPVDTQSKQWPAVTLASQLKQLRSNSWSDSLDECRVAGFDFNRFDLLPSTSITKLTSFHILRGAGFY